MTKTTAIFLAFFLLSTNIISAQNTNEREHRIRKTQFPIKALGYIKQQINPIKQLRFYKEIDDDVVIFIAKFKKDRLRYSMHFNKESVLENVKITIKTIDIPEESFQKIESYLKGYFTQYRIRRILQQYPVTNQANLNERVKDAFQNLLLSDINYELFVAGKNERKFELHQALFNYKGEFIAIRKSLPPNYDHVLY